MNSDQTTTNTEMSNNNTQELPPSSGLALPPETTDNQQLSGEGQKAEAKTRFGRLQDTT